MVNYEEGSEQTYAMGDDVNKDLCELPSEVEAQRDVAIESAYEYGSQAGIWRRFRVFAAAGVPITCLAAAVALERNPAVARKLTEREDEAAGHGYRWSNHFEMNRDEEREAIARAVKSITATTGHRPRGWYCREMSTNPRELVVEEGGFVYDFDCYNDDLPCWTMFKGRPHLVTPYALVVNDARFVETLPHSYRRPRSGQRICHCSSPHATCFPPSPSRQPPQIADLKSYPATKKS